MTPRAVRRSLSGWGKFPVQTCAVYRPERLGELQGIIAGAPEASLIARGMGRSYGDAALNRDQGVIVHDRRDRFMAFDPGTGVVRCEAGVSLADIVDVLLPRGFFLPVTPGTKNISVGGAVAANVHGKNHHRDGAISSQVLELRLLTADAGVLTCSREENTDLFWATIGGMGLTGVILDVRLRLRQVATAYVHCSTEQTRDLDASLERMLESDDEYAYSVAWIDCLARGRSLGRSVLLRANPAPVDALPENLRSDPLAVSATRRVGVPFELPSLVLNRHSVRLFNSAFYRAHGDSEALLDYETYFYRLDAVPNWNRIYGRRGVLQYQAVIPMPTAGNALRDILERTATAGASSFLAVLKRMGKADSGPLSFPMEGMTLALDFPYTGDHLVRLLNQLDEIVAASGGRVYFAKDSCLRPELVSGMYPELERFRNIKSRYDPEGRYSSSLARRLRLLEEA